MKQQILILIFIFSTIVICDSLAVNIISSDKRLPYPDRDSVTVNGGSEQFIGNFGDIEGVSATTIYKSDLVNCRQGEFTACEYRPKTSEKEYCEMLSDTGIGALPAKCLKYYK